MPVISEAWIAYIQEPRAGDEAPRIHIRRMTGNDAVRFRKRTREE